MAIVETKLEQMEEDALRREETQTRMLEKLETLQDSLNSVNNTLTKYHGFIGGIMFVASSIGIFLLKFWSPFWNLVTKPHA